MACANPGRDDPTACHLSRSKPMSRVNAVGLALCALSGLSAPAALAQPTPLPADVQRFVAQREQCDHFRGEEPYDRQRARFIAQQVRRHCTGTDRRLAALKRKYEGQAAVQARLGGFEARIE
jgi:hypothetical protein